MWLHFSISVEKDEYIVLFTIQIWLQLWDHTTILSFNILQVNCVNVLWYQKNKSDNDMKSEQHLKMKIMGQAW